MLYASILDLPPSGAGGTLIGQGGGARLEDVLLQSHNVSDHTLSKPCRLKDRPFYD